MSDDDASVWREGRWWRSRVVGDVPRWCGALRVVLCMVSPRHHACEPHQHTHERACCATHLVLIRILHIITGVTVRQSTRPVKLMVDGREGEPRLLNSQTKLRTRPSPAEAPVTPQHIPPTHLPPRTRPTTAPGPQQWRATAQCGREGLFDSVVLTMPAPQMLTDVRTPWPYVLFV